jgi:glycosyltransferase involved in cell wall biosynthesis
MTSMARRRLGWFNLRARRSVAVGLLRIYRRFAPPTREDGIGVVTVGFNSERQLRVLLDALQRYTDEPLEILVVDNGSSDGTADLLAGRPDVRCIRLPLNVGHGPALDLGVLRSDASRIVVLDVDAFPVSHRWLAEVLEPLSSGSSIAGAFYQRAYIHPCFLALRRADFMQFGLSFVPVGRVPRKDAPRSGLFLDVGEALSQVLALRFGTRSLHKIEPTSTRGPGMIGTVFGDVVYHNFFSTHGDKGSMHDGALAWQEAVAKYVDG